MDVLDRILALREAKGWTEYKLSVESGIPQSTISSWFRKGVQPSVHSLEAICSACGITMAQFFAEPDAPCVYPSELQNRLFQHFSHLSIEQQEALVYFLETCEPKA